MALNQKQKSKATTLHSKIIDPNKLLGRDTVVYRAGNKGGYFPGNDIRKYTELFEYDGKVFTAFIQAVPAPRMTRGQLKLLHAKRLTKAQQQVKDRIIRYNNFKNTLLLIANTAKFVLPDTFHVIIGIITNKPERIGKPHQQVPDFDNYIKGTVDALRKSDANIWDVRVTKIWSTKNFITIQPLS